MKLQVTKKAEHKFKKGYPLIQKEDLQQVPLLPQQIGLL